MRGWALLAFLCWPLLSMGWVGSAGVSGPSGVALSLNTFSFDAKDRNIYGVRLEDNFSRHVQSLFVEMQSQSAEPTFDRPFFYSYRFGAYLHSLSGNLSEDIRHFRRVPSFPFDPSRDKTSRYVRLDGQSMGLYVGGQLGWQFLTKHPLALILSGSFSPDVLNSGDITEYFEYSGSAEVQLSPFLSVYGGLFADMAHMDRLGVYRGETGRNLPLQSAARLGVKWYF